MSFFEQPIINSPYLVPQKHRELDGDGRPTDTIVPKRRRSDLISAMPKPNSVKGGKQAVMELSTAGLTGQDMAYNVTEFVNAMRSQVDAWRQLPNPNDWQVSPITQRLLQHWRAIQKDETQVIRPFFCQLEAVETAVWMTEVAPGMGERGRRVRRRLEAANAEANPDLFRVATGAGKRIVNQWRTEGHLHCTGGDSILRAVLDPYTPTGSTLGVNFNTSKTTRYQPRPDRSHLNWIVTDSDWEDKLAAAIEDHPAVLSYAKNHNLGLEVPYLVEGEPRRYRPDFLIRLEAPEPTTLVIEVKGYRGHDAMLKAETMRAKWIPAVNRLGTHGRWGFAELREVHDFGPALDAAIGRMLGRVEASDAVPTASTTWKTPSRRSPPRFTP